MVATPWPGFPARRGEPVTRLCQERCALRNRLPQKRHEDGNIAAVPRKQKKPSCEDCYFHKNLLCALELGEPCGTFRPNRPEGLVPPKQPVLLMRPPRWASQAGTA
jgi:hypothetical protein